MQSLMLWLSGRIEALAEVYHVFLRQKEDLWEMKKINNAFGQMKNAVNHFHQNCSKFLKYLFCQKCPV